MPQYADLGTETQAALTELLSMVRPLAAQIYKFAQKNRVPYQLWFSNPEGQGSTLADLVNSLDAGALIPNETDLAQADQVTKEGLETVMGYVGVVAGHDTSAHLNVMLPFAGGPNFQA